MTFDEIEEEAKKHSEELISKAKEYTCGGQFKNWSGRDLADAFWTALAMYQKEPSLELLRVMEHAFNWAVHADHGLAHSFNHAWKWIGFNLLEEYEKFGSDPP